ncbi:MULTISPECIES: fumarylacetoacetate hydrolase family protein [unclassified Microbacterium]|uniref:fumarylacetoacetate hydrolase family protein n=1 Tax=unclassified Microbacterium TaxID=2609290 RepID=UPI0023653171|nr:MULTISPECIES: fumarylacetoacetate hydrolase family protein [unclassified Microbacterium]MDQ1206686.1 2-keto-4-pentenoate hydratase/2-oxohepta-3-ene-1,7-dioic acid hydratase in catechol pathway [Microbacterium sp. SORGH_AS_0862]MDR6198130.1 2-keto-4-pentenoate hydratase/2-oxohepta-3-ene-1,7-dioic acid hydratase in catechol pathway [Microbacterium sp. SORGH_AS_0428]MDY0828952.1 fumarylacetoacetate hydrolase family protein [Microbacterium sp. BG28]WDG16800.1 fumarylacetoacetate hydrolase family
MKIARFSHQDAIAYGIVDDDELVQLAGDPMFAGFEPTGKRIPIADVALLAPVIPRSKVVAIGRNYRAHAEELGNDVPAEPLMFLKPNTAVIGPGDVIVRPTQSERVDFEGELVVVIGRIAKNVPVEKALDVVFGYTVGNDVTARDLQRSDGQWSRAKGFDTFCPLGPVIETEFDPASAARVVTRVNGDERQSAPLTDLMFPIAELIAYASSVFTLLPGDVIMTGTPAGVGPLVAGDEVEVEVEGIGVLRNTVRDA